MTSDDTDECPLCMEPFEVDDMSFYPCTCGYQICRFCWHRLKIDGNGLCPACRKPYSENPAHFEPLSEDEIIRIKKERRHKEVQKKQKLSENRRHLADVRVVQKNLVFVVGLSQRLADAEVLKKIEYFGKFGKIMKVVINSSPSYAGTQTPSASAYLTYSKPDEALKAIQTVNNIQIDNRVLKASLGTTKYCSHFLKGIQCPKVDCMYLHDLGEEAASFTKEQMSQGKHLDYESKLIECILHIPRNLQNISTTTITPGTTTTTTNVENSNTNQLGFIPQTNTVIPGTTTAAATALTTATSSSVSIIPPPATSTTPPIVQNSVSPVSNLTTNTVTHTSSTSNTNNQENKGESIKSKPKLKSTSSSSSSNRTDKTVSAVVASASTTTSLLTDNKPDENIVNDSDEVLIDKEEDIFNRNRKYNTTLEESDADFTNYLSSKTYNNNENINLDLTSTNNILNGRLDNVLLNGFSNNTALQQEEDLGFDPWGESTKALQDLMKMEKVTTTDQLENYENLLYLKAQSLNQNFLNLKLSSSNNNHHHHQHQDYNNSINSNGNSSHTIDENRHNHLLFHRSLNGQHFDEKSSTSSSSSLSLKSNDPVKLNPSLYNNSLPLTSNKTQQQQQQLNNRESLNDVMFQNSILMNNSNNNNSTNISSSTGHFTSNFNNNNNNNNENSEYYNNNNNQESYLNKILLKNNLSKVIVPPPGFNNTATTSVNNNTTFNSPISTSTTNSSSSSTSSSVNNSTSTTPSLNLNLINQAKQIANAYQINDLKKINESVARNLKNKENDCSKLLTDVNDYSAQDRSNKNSFNLNNDENLINTQTNKLNISNLQETFRQIFPNAHISFGAASPAINNNNNNNNNHQQASNFQNNKNQYIIDEQLLKQNCWPDDPAIVSLNGGINDCNIQRLANEKIQQDSLNNMFMNQNQPDLSFLTNSSQANNINNNSLNFNNLLRKQTEQQQMNTSLLNQFQMLYQQHHLAQLNALKNKQAQTLKTNQAINTNINNNNNLNGNYFQNMSSNLNNINAIYNNHNSNLLDNYISGVNDVNSFNTTNNTNMNNYYVIDSNQNIQTTNLNKNNLSVSSLSLPQQNFMQQFISSITPNSNGE